MLKQRLITSFIGLPILIAIVWFGKPWFSFLIALWGMVAAYEFYRITLGTKISVLSCFGIIWTLLFIIYPYFKFEAIIPLLTSAILLPLIYLLFRRGKEHAFNDWLWTIGGILYIGWLLSFLVILREYQSDGRNWVFLALFTTFASDTSAYFIGKKWGKNHMAPSISPKKTWEGAIAGVCGAVIVSLLFTIPTPLAIPGLSFWGAILLGVLVSIFGQVGDLVESLFKRNRGVKDSSNFLPGHGGFLDRMDSVVFAGVLVYYYVIWVMPHL